MTHEADRRYDLHDEVLLRSIEKEFSSFGDRAPGGSQVEYFNHREACKEIAKLRMTLATIRNYTILWKKGDAINVLNNVHKQAVQALTAHTESKSESSHR